jgi:DNA primase
MAGRIPPEFIDELLARVDIVDVIEPRVRLKKTGRDHQGLCPFHQEKSPSFTVSQSKQFYHCFGCGAHGSAIGFLMENDRMEFRDAVEELAASVGLAVPEDDRADNKPKPSVDLYDVSLKAAEAYQHALRHHESREQAIDYLKARGLTGEIAAAFGLGYAPPGWDFLLKSLAHLPNATENLEKVGLALPGKQGHYDRFRERITFPIRDRRGRVVGFGGRVLGDEKPKYLNSPETPIFHKGRELYGLFEAREALRKPERLLVVEGYMDVVALAQFDIRYAVAALGTACTTQQLELAFRATPEVIFCFDGDKAGRQAAERGLENALPALREGRQVRFLFLPEGHDPDSLVREEGKERFEQRVAAAETLSEFMLSLLSKQADISTLDGRARLLELARPMLGRIPSGIYRDLLTKRLAEVSKTEDVYVGGLIQSATDPRVRSKQIQTPFAGWTPVRKAVAMLLHQPALADAVENVSCWQQIETPGVDLLVAMIEMRHSNPNLTPAHYLERWRDREESKIFTTLQQWQMPFNEADALTEFTDIANRLNWQLRDQRIGQLSGRPGSLRDQRIGQLSGRPGSQLSTEEKAELRRLLQEKAIEK